MATGASAQPGRGVVTTHITPGADFRTGEAEAWETAGRTLKKFEEAGKPNLIRRAQALGAAEGLAVAAGEKMPERSILFSGDLAEARTRALQESYTAKIRSDIDAREAEIRREHQYDPEAYDRAAREMRSGFIQGSPHEFAVDVEEYANTRVARGMEVVSSARAQRDEQEVNQALNVRIATLDERLIALSAEGKGDSFDYLQADAERGALQEERVANPAILYSDAQRYADDEKLGDGILSANVTRLGIETYGENGRGMPGYAAGVRFFQREVLEGEAFADVDPERRRRIYRDAVAQLRDYAAADREEDRAIAEEARQRAAEQREKVGDLRLAVLLGEVSETDIRARDDIDDGAKAGLITAARAQARRDRADAERDAREERAGRTDAYSALRDAADAGRLDHEEVANQLAAGLITPGQAQTLRDRNDTQLRPLISDVMAPVADATNRPGASVRGNTRVLSARAEEAAAAWVRANPSATLEDRLKAGEAIRDRFFGGRAGAGRPAAGTPAQGQASRLGALEAERRQRQARGQPMSQAEYNRRRNEIVG